MRAPFAALALIAATAAPLASLAPAAAHTAEPDRVTPRATLLTINADGKSARTPDLATFSAGVQSTGTSAGEAIRANAAAMSRVVAALRRTGVAERDIQTSQVNLNPVYADSTPREPNAPPRITGYMATNTVAIRQRDIAAMGKVIDTLVEAGANDINGPGLTLDDPTAAQDEARLAAMKTARARAELYARAAGLRVVRIVSISESMAFMPQPMARMAMAKAADATPIAAGEVGLTVNVNVQFELAP